MTPPRYEGGHWFYSRNTGLVQVLAAAQRNARRVLSGTLITTADHDDRVVPSYSFKFAATLQAAQGCDKPVLIRIETQASHAYRPTDKRIAELADGWAFALANMRVRLPDTATR